MKANKRILICVDWFRPAFQAGGPIQSVGAMVDHLSDRDDIDIHILTSAYDLGGNKPLDGIQTGTFMDKGRFKVRYLLHEEQTPQTLDQVLDELNPDLVYLNSLFSKYFTLAALKACKRSDHQVLLAPRGMLHAGALSKKALKKKVFLNVTRWLGTFKGVKWHATSDFETKRIEKFYPGADVQVARNLPRQLASTGTAAPSFQEGRKYIYVGRISEEKGVQNLVRAFLAHTAPSSTLSIAGPSEDSEYGQTTLSLISTSEKVNYLGAMAPDKVPGLISEHHFFITATLGENFGHSIAEALHCGRPAIVPDTTPWQELQAEPSCGFTFSGQEVSKGLEWAETLDEKDWKLSCSNAHKRFERYLHSSGVIEENAALFT